MRELKKAIEDILYERAREASKVGGGKIDPAKDRAYLEKNFSLDLNATPQSIQKERIRNARMAAVGVRLTGWIFGSRRIQQIMSNLKRYNYVSIKHGNAKILR